MADQPARPAEEVRSLGRDCFADVCPWCRCKGYHSEFCEGFEVNDPAARVERLVKNLEESLAAAKAAAAERLNDGTGTTSERSSEPEA